MKFAIINNIRTEAVKGAKGLCPNCGSELIAKCGDVRINYWAHKSVRNCDPWWENETEWHRTWKGNFPTDWQERTFTDEVTGEKHRADVYTAHELIIEFQYSHLDPSERAMREGFYKNIIWVIDGTRLKRDYPRFLKGKEGFRPTNTQGQYFLDFPDECFPSTWVGGLRPVIFDFKGTDEIIDPKDWRNYLYYLAPKTNVRESLVTILTRESFIDNITNGSWFKRHIEPQQQMQKPPIKSNPTIPQSQSQHVYHRGRLVKRRRL